MLGSRTLHRLLICSLLAGGVAAQEPTQVPDPTAEPPPTVATESPPNSSPGTEAEGSKWVRGFVELRYIGRWTEFHSDNDLFAYYSLDFGNPNEDMVTAHVTGTANLDMDRDRDPTNPFFEVRDTYSKDLTAQLYGAYVDINSTDGNPVGKVFKRVRVGRQVFYGTPVTLLVDGAYVQTMPATDYADLTLHAYGGLPSNLWESSPDDDWVAGAAVSASPWRASLLRFDYAHVTDKWLGTTSRDDLIGLRGWQRFGTDWTVDAYLNFLESDTRDAGAHASWTPGEGDFTLSGRWAAVLTDQRRQSISLDYFTPIMRVYNPYDQFEVLAHKGFGDHVYFDGGISARELRDDNDEGTFNHEFRRYYLTSGLTDWPGEGVYGDLTFEYWDAGGDDFTALGFDLGKKFDERWDLSLGTYFQLFRYNLLVGEQTDVQVYYAKVTHQVSEHWRLHGMFEWEESSTDYVTLLLSARTTF